MPSQISAGTRADNKSEFCSRVASGYILLNSLLILSYACADWDLAAQRASHQADVPEGWYRCFKAHQLAFSDACQDKVIDDVDAEKATTTKSGPHTAGLRN